MRLSARTAALASSSLRFDILAEVVCEDDDALIELLNDKVRGVEGVSGTETFVYLQLNKQKYDWGTR